MSSKKKKNYSALKAFFSSFSPLKFLLLSFEKRFLNLKKIDRRLSCSPTNLWTG
jgi:hypothetical protein